MPMVGRLKRLIGPPAHLLEGLVGVGSAGESIL
jgi:hypothetical protein